MPFQTLHPTTRIFFAGALLILSPALWAAKKAKGGDEGPSTNALALVDADQTSEFGGSGPDAPDGRIRLSAISFQFAHPSSYADATHTAPKAIDGDLNTSWTFAKDKTEAWIEISLGLPTPIRQLTLNESDTPVTRHRVEYHDADGWKTLYEGGALDRAGRRFPTVVAGALRITLMSAGGGGLKEIEVYRDLSAPTPKADTAVLLAPKNQVVGKSLAFVGFSAPVILDGGNQGPWLKYFAINGLRSWYTASRHVVAGDLSLGEAVADVEAFDARKAALRADPLKSGFIQWEAIAKRSRQRLVDKENAWSVDEANRVMKDLGITPLCELNMSKWDETWQTAWLHWVTIYAWVFHQARTAGVCRYQYANEPETFAKSISPALYVRSLQIHADAIRAAVEDVNRLYKMDLKPIFAAPVLASSGTSDLARLMMRNLYTDYRGRTVKDPLVQWFNKHRYGSRPRAYEAEFAEMNAMMVEESPDRTALPIVYSEFNYSTGRMWDRPEVTFHNDTPDVFRNEASLWGLAAENGIKAMYQFKFADGRRKGNNVCFTMVREQDPGTPAGDATDISDSTRNAEVTRLFAEGFSRERPLLATGVRSADVNVRPLVGRDSESGRHYLWLAQPNSRADYPTRMDYSGLGLKPGAFLCIKEVSADHFGDVVHRQSLDAGNVLDAVQPRDSVWLVSVEPAALSLTESEPLADGEVVQGAAHKETFGKGPTLGIHQGAPNGANRISFLKWKAPPVGAKALARAFLCLSGRSLGSGPTTLLVYGTDQSTWNEATLCADNAPAVNRTVSSVAKVDLHTRPLAHAVFQTRENRQSLDVTPFLLENLGREITFILIREKRFPDEDWGKLPAELHSKESPAVASRPSLEMWWKP